MDIINAMKVFDISDIISETDTSLKKKYRVLMRKYHPDSCGGSDDKAKEISTAYSALLGIMDKIKSFNLSRNASIPFVIIGLHELCRIYNNETITVIANGSEQKITKGDLKRYNIMIALEVAVYHNGVQEVYSNLEPWNISDKYNVKCDIHVTSLNGVEDIQIGFLNTMRDIKLDSSITSIVFTEKYNIKVSVEFFKKLYSQK